MFAWIVVSIVTSVFSWKCGVDHDWKSAEKEYSKHGRDLAEALPRGTVLQPIRIKFEYLFGLTSEQQSHIMNEILPVANLWFTNTLRVYPLTTNLIISDPDCYDAEISLEHQIIGVPDTDVIIYVYAASYGDSFDSRAGPCLRDNSGRNQPLVGIFEINSSSFFDLSLKDQIDNALHQITHVLVFTANNMNYFVRQDGTPYEIYEKFQITTIRDKTAINVILPNVVAKAKEIFGCATIDGLELEDSGLEVGSHWEARIVPQDIMIAYLPQSPVMSDLTVALFQDSGWYVVSYDYTQPLVWGNNAGCSWFTDKCITSTNTQPGFCNEENQQTCNVFGTGGAYCSTTTWSSELPSQHQYFADPYVGGSKDYPDFCPIITTYADRFCQDPLAIYFGLTLGEIVGPTSRCISSTLYSKLFSYVDNFLPSCYKINACTSTYATVQVGSSTINCPFTGGNFTVPGYHGVLICPNSDILCRQVPCYQSCYQRGKCINSSCVCEAGFGDQYCGTKCGDTCKTCDVSTTCLSCYSNAVLAVSGVCTCPSGSTWDSTNKLCQTGIVGCPSICKACATEMTCAACKSTAVLVDGICSCPIGTSFDTVTNYCELITGCPNTCKLCASASTCETCKSTGVLIDGVCNCPDGTAFSSELNVCQAITDCSPICNECATSTTCLSCKTASTLSNGVCSCLAGFTLNSISSECVPITGCSSICNGCATSTSCLECKSTAIFADGDCTCPTGSTIDLAKGTCIPITGCSSICDGCSTPTSCLACKSTSILDNGVCSCPAGFTFDSTTSICVPITGCSSTCNGCATASTCLACKSTATLSNGACTCFPGSEIDSTTGECSIITDCSPICNGCASKTSCLACKSSAILVDGLCTCPEATDFSFDSLECKEITGCPTICQRCATESTCLACKSTAILLNGACICPQGTSFSTSTSLCEDITHCDPLCEDCATISTCLACKSNAELLNDQCVCSEGFTLNPDDSKCDLCRNNFLNSELTAYYSSDYLSVYIDFARSVEKTTNNCTSIFEDNSLNKFGMSPTCRWETNNRLQVILGQGYTLTSENVGIKPESILPNGNECRFISENLIILVQYLDPMPIPTAVITAPNTYSLGCSSNDLAISGETSIGTGLSYTWLAQANPEVSAITSYINSQTASKFRIPVASLVATDLTITLTVTNPQLQSHNTVSNVLIQSDYALQVTVDAGSNPFISQSLTYQFKTIVSQLCGNSTVVNYKWTYVKSSSEAPAINSAAILANSKLSYILVINANQLLAPYWYIFNAAVSDGYAQGYSTLNITVKRSDLVLILSRTDGSASYGTDLIIKADDSYDPDNAAGSLAFEWSCFENNAACKDSLGNDLITNEKLSILTILSYKLKVGSKYLFSAIMRKDTRSATKSVTISIVQSSVGSNEIENLSTKFAVQNPLIIYASVAAPVASTFSWSQTSDSSLTPTGSTTNSFIVFEPNTMSQGATYAFTLTLTLSTGSTLTATATWLTNKGPECDGVTISGPFSNTYLLDAISCVDGDNTDIPLSYQPGVILNDKTFYLLTPSKSSSHWLSLWGSDTGLVYTVILIMRVCDTLNTCVILENTVTVMAARLLQNISIFEFFLASIINQDSIPASIIMFGYLEIDHPTLSLMFTKLEEFMDGQFIMDKGVLDTLISCIYAMLDHPNLLNQNYTDNAVKILEDALERYTGIIHDSQIEDINIMFGTLYKNVTDITKLNKIYSTLSNLWIRSSILGGYKNYYGESMILNYRDTGAQMKSAASLKYEEYLITFLPEIKLNDSEIYDASIFIYPNAGEFSDIFDLTIYKSGTYENFNLHLTNPEIFILDSEERAIQIIAPFVNDINKTWECAKLENEIWLDNSCEVISTWDLLEKTASITFEVNSTGTYQILEKVTVEDPNPISDTKSCENQWGPIIAIFVILFISSILVVICLLTNFVQFLADNDHSFFEYWLISSPFVIQKSQNRVYVIIHLASVLLIELGAIGAFYQIDDEPTNDGKKDSFSNHADMYEGQELQNMVAGLLIGQLVSIILWFLKKDFEKPIYKILFLVVSGTLSLLSIAGIVAMTIEYCAEYVSYWIINFIIVIPFDFFIFQPIIGYANYKYQDGILNLNKSTSTIKSDNIDIIIDEDPDSNQV